MSADVRRLHPEVVAHTICPNGHTETLDAINPVFTNGELDHAYWQSAIDFCMDCEEPIAFVEIEVRR